MSIGIFSSQNTNNSAIACRRFFAGPSFSRWHSTCSRLAGALALSLGSLAAFSPQAQAAGGNFGGGTGVVGNPYVVEDAADLAAINNDAAHLAASYKLAHDIDLSAWLAGPGNDNGAGWNPIGRNAPFTGNLDGAGYKITGLWINRPATDRVGLFASLSSAAIANLGVEFTVNTNGVIGGSATGGLAGVQGGGSIINSYVTGAVFGSGYAGGLVGEQSSGSITNSYAAGFVTVAGSGTSVGGLVGAQMNNSSITNSYASSNVNGDNGNTGGLVGFQHYSSITNSYATGNVTGSSTTGGLVGRQEKPSSITNSYAAGHVIGNDSVGGLVGAGAYSGSTISASFFDVQTTGQTNGMGDGYSAGAAGLTTALMQTQATFTNAGWAFGGASPVWFMPPGDYPKLSWQQYSSLYTIAASASAGGTIDPSGAVTAVAGTSRGFTLTPDTWYKIASVNSTCGGALSGNTYTTSPITTNCSVSAVFTPITYTVTTSAGVGGTIDPLGAVTVSAATTRWLVVTPDTGYRISWVSGCGGALYIYLWNDDDPYGFHMWPDHTYLYKIADITGDCSVTATFARAHTVTASAGPGGTISPSGAVTVDSGATRSFTVTPNTGNKISSVSGCNGTLNGNTYKTGAITADCAVKATFARVYTVTASAGPGGSISPSGDVPVDLGQTLSFKVTPNMGHSIASVGGTCGGMLAGGNTSGTYPPVFGTIIGLLGGAGAGNTYKTDPITADCTVTATFMFTQLPQQTNPPKQAYTITVSSDQGGTITPSGTFTVKPGATKTFTVTPDPAYGIASMDGTCEGKFDSSIDHFNYKASHTYTTKAINADCTLVARFTNAYPINSCDVTVVSSTGGGTFTPPVVPVGGVPCGSTLTFTLTPNPGYNIFAPGGDCGGSLDGNVYTTKAINKGYCSIDFRFAPVKTNQGYYTITASTSTTSIGTGSIAPSGNILVSPGATKTFTIGEWPPNHTLNFVGGTCGGVYDPIKKTYTTNPIYSNCSVVAQFN